MTDRQYLAWLSFLRWRNDPSAIDGIDMDGCVPPETQRRWASKVASANMEGFHAAQRAKSGAAFAPSGKPLRPARPTPPGAPPVTPRPNRWDVAGKTLPGVKPPAARAEPPGPEGGN